MKNKPELKWGFWQTIFVVVGAYVLSIFTAAAASLLLDDNTFGEVEKNFTVYAVNAATLLFVAWLFLKKKGVKLKTFFKLKDKFSLFWLPVYYLVYAFLTVIVQSFFGQLPGYNPNQDQQLGFPVVQGSGLILIFISLVILPPLGEEVLFRGILYPGLKTRLSKISSALITSALFGLAHMQWNVGVDTFVLSLVLIFALEKHKSIWLAIGLHAIKNFIAFLALFVFTR